MRQIVVALVIVLGGLAPGASPDRALALGFDVPRDRMFYVEATPAYAFKATLAEDWTFPNAGEGTLHVYAPVLPELPGQAKVSTRLFVAGNDTLKAEEVSEGSVSKRPMLALHMKSDQLSLKSGVPLRLVYEGTLCARTLKRGKPPTGVPELTEEERRRYLMTSATMDHNDPEFLRWMGDQGLKRRKDEQAMAFAHRVFDHFVKEATYGGDTGGYEARRPSRVCKSFANDCGGLSLLYVAVMRANDVPARTLFGRWAIRQTDNYGQYHVMAEFFVDKSGWVPVDIAGSLVHKPKDPNALFGNTDGQFLAFHVDTDLEPSQGCHHAWAQYLLLQWAGAGDFGKDQRGESKWNVTRKTPAEVAAEEEIARKARQQAEARALREAKEAEAARRKRERAAAEQREKDEEFAAAQVRYAKKLIDRGDPTTAKERLQKVLKEYPDTKAAPEARELLDKLK
jgi:hypothetical protein